MTEAEDTTEKDADKLADQIVEVMRRRREEEANPERPPVEVPGEPAQMQLWRRIITMREWFVERIRDWEEFVAGSTVEQPYAADQIALLRDELVKMDATIEKGTRYDAKQRGLTFAQMEDLANVLEADRDADMTWWIEHYLKQKARDDVHTDMTKRSVQMLFKRLLGRSVDLDALEVVANAARTQNRARPDGTDGTGMLDRKAKRMLEIVKRG